MQPMQPMQPMHSAVPCREQNKKGHRRIKQENTSAGQKQIHARKCTFRNNPIPIPIPCPLSFSQIRAPESWPMQTASLCT